MSTLHVFVSYSHLDERWVQEGPRGLTSWLAHQLRRFEVDFWYDHALRSLPGEDYKKKIREEINAADFALLLISQNFICSDFICQYELPWIKERLDREELTIIPILVGPTDWEGEERLLWLRDRQMLPGKPTPLIDYVDNDARFENVRVEILSAIKSRILELRKARAAGKKEPVPVGGATSTKPTEPIGQGGPGSTVAPVAPPDKVAPVTSSGDAGKAVHPVRDGLPVPSDVRDAVRTALRDTVVQGGYGLTDKNSGVVWRGLYDSFKGPDLPRELCSLLLDAGNSWDTNWKIVTFLKYSIRTPAGREMSSSILDTVANALTHAGHVGRAALETIVDAPIPAKEKWRRLFSALPTVPDDGLSGVIANLVKFAGPPEEKEQTGSAVYDILLRTTQSSAVSAATDAIWALNYRKHIVEMRQLVPTEEDYKASRIVQVLTEWGDRESIPAIRQGIENRRYSAIVQVVDMLRCLYRLEGASCTTYIAEVLLSASPRVQQSVLNSLDSFGGMNAKPLAEAVSKLAGLDSDPEVKKAADGLLAKTRQRN